MDVFDDTVCELGEGPLWHPINQQLLWFDILTKRLFCKGLTDTSAQQWQFDEHVSAAGWVDSEHLLIASETALFKFNLRTAAQQHLCDLEADKPDNRSNDGRADPWGGFWIGTMGKQNQPQAGAIYRYYQGQLKQLKSQITITNAICFSADKRFVYYTDTAEQIVWRQTLDEQGWPINEACAFLDLREQDLNPDGAIIDQQGNMWVAQWDAARVAQYSANGEYLSAVDLPTDHISCPAFGGPGMQKLFVTSSKAWLSKAKAASQPAGKTFFIDTPFKGIPEPAVNC